MTKEDKPQAYTYTGVAIPVTVVDPEVIKLLEKAFRESEERMKKAFTQHHYAAIDDYLKAHVVPVTDPEEIKRIQAEQDARWEAEQRKKTEEDKPYTIDDCLNQIAVHVETVGVDQASHLFIRDCLKMLWNAAIDRCNDAADEDIDDFYYIKED